MAETVSAIRINTKLKLDGLKKDLKELEKDLKEVEKHGASNEAQKAIDKQSEALEKSKKKVEELNKKHEEQLQKQKELEKQAEKEVKNDPTNEKRIDKVANDAMKQLPSDATDEERDVAAAEAVAEEYQKMVDAQLETNKEYQKTVEQAEATKEKIGEQLTAQEELNATIEQAQAQKEIAEQIENENIANIKEQISENEKLQEKIKERAEKEKEVAIQQNKQKSTLKGMLRKITKLGLSVLGVRAAYAGIRKVISSVTSDNEKLKNTIDGIWAGVGSAFEPMISGVIQGFATILNYALAIAKALTGINFIAKANKKLSDKKTSSKSSNLASFDKSEVLNKDSGSGSTTDNYLKEIELNEKLLALVQKIKSTLSSYYDAIMPSLQRIWKSSKEIFGAIAEIVLGTINDVLVIFEPAVTWFSDVLANLFEKIAEWLSNEEVKEGLTTLATLFLAVVAAITLFNVVSALAGGILTFLTSPLVIIAGLIALLITCFGDWGAVIDDVQLILDGLMNFITGVFTGNWEQAWNGIVQIFAGVWNGLIDIVQSVLNGITWAINKVIDGINALLSKVPDWLGISSWSLDHLTAFDITGYKYIPQLANGAVLPPNKPFIAQLGDQTNGRNLEAPEDLIRQIVREESGSGAITLKISADSKASEFVRWLRFEIDEENKRVGTELVTEG